MIYVKRGVTPKNLTIMAAVANAAEEVGVALTVTSGTDGKHMTGSKHYIGGALDVRTRGLTPEERRDVMSVVKRRLGKGYDVVLESDHLHVEWDPA
jgi:hypothetical protein